jgi:hypothetical protein
MKRVARLRATDEHSLIKFIDENVAGQLAGDGEQHQKKG